MPIPLIVYGATNLAFSQPPRPWTSGTVGVGAGVEWSAAGVPSAWITRREHPLAIVQRITEGEWPAVRAWLEHAQAGGAFDWYPDATALDKYTCYLVSPTIDEIVQPARGQFPGDLEVTFSIRRADGAAIDVEYF